MFRITRLFGIGKTSKRCRCLRVVVLSCVLLSTSVLCRAEIDCIQLTLPEGVTETILLSSRPKVRMDSTLIAVVYDDNEISIPLENGLKVRLLDSQQTRVKTAISQTAYFTVSESGIACHGLPERETVRLFNAGGAVVCTADADELGNVFLPLPALEGFYVMVAGNYSFKFYIK